MHACHSQSHSLEKVIEILLRDLLHYFSPTLLGQQRFLFPLSSHFDSVTHCAHIFLLGIHGLSFQRFLMSFGGECANAILSFKEMGQKFIARWVVGLHGEVDASEVEIFDGPDSGEGARGPNLRQMQGHALLANFLLACLHLIKLYAESGTQTHRVKGIGKYNSLIQVLMASELRLKRLKNQYDEAIEAMQDEDDEKVDPAIRAIILANSKGADDFTEWTFIFQGKEYTCLQGGNYKMRVKATEAYPYEPPEVWMLDGFQHFHVFAGGKVCFKLLNKENWKLGYSIAMLVNGIIKMLHSDPEVSDPASTSLPRLVQKGETRYHQPNLKEYNAFLKAQAKRFANRYQSEIKSFEKQHGIKRREQLHQKQLDQ